MLHVYALVRHPAAIPDARGIGETELRSVELGEQVDAIVSEGGTIGTPTEEAILAHARVVEAVAATNDSVLPVRFAGAVADDDELRRRLSERQEPILAALERVHGCVELAVRVLQTSPSSEEPEPRSGRDYMRRRLDEVGRAEQLARELHGSLAAAAKDSACRVVAKENVVMTGAYLVPRAELDRFDAALAAAERDRHGLTFVSSGPWPPYSFALLEADAA